MTAPGDDRVRYRPPATLLSRGLSRAARLTQRRRRTTYRVVNRLDRKAFAARLGAVLRQRDDVAIVRLGGQLRLLLVEPDLDVARVAQRNLDLVVDVCERHSIRYFLVRTTSTAARRVGLHEEDRERFARALAATYADEPVYVTTRVAGRGRRRITVTELARDASTHAGHADRVVVSVHRYYYVPGARLRYGLRHACEVDLWGRDEAGTLVSGRTNRVANRIPSPEQVPARVLDGGRSYETLRPFTRTLLDDVDFPVDVVYTWVDGSDPAWQARKDEVLREHSRPATAPVSIDESRFRSHDELRYSLRSLAQFAPWIRHVYLVTDDQVPDWLDPASPRITIVDHKEIFADQGGLPTFNSHAIECRLHHIEGLSEHYLYLNDDVLFGRPVRPELFFHGNGTSKFFLSRATIEPGAPRPDDLPHDAARKATSLLLERDFGRAPTQVFKHTPVPQQRSLLRELEQRYPEEFARTAASQFRSASDVIVATWLHHYYGYLTRRALAAPIVYDFFAVSQQRALRRMSRLLARRYADCFCLNDHGEPDVSDETRVDLLNRFLTTYYPFPSEFEKDRRVVATPSVFPGADVGAQDEEAASDGGAEDVEAASDEEPSEAEVQDEPPDLR